jgi:ribonuclease HI
MGLQFATKQSNIKNLIIKGDSQLVIKQMKGEYKVNSENIKNLYKKAKECEKMFESVKYCHVYRKDNKRADELSNKGLLI